MNVFRATKKPVTVECMEWSGSMACHDALVAWGCPCDTAFDDKASLRVRTLEGDHIASIGDIIIKGVKGEFYPCKPDIFAATYSVEATR